MSEATLPRILCVDDEPHVLEALSRILRRQFEVVVAVGGEEGLRAAAEGPFAVVLSDQRMPGMAGVTFLETLRTQMPDAVRVLLTGHADTASAIDAVNRGAVFRFPSKPIGQAGSLRQVVRATFPQPPAEAAAPADPPEEVAVG